MNKITYILPDSDFFNRLCGRVSHAKGIIDGLIDNNVEVNVYSEERINIYIDNQDKLIKTNFIGGDELSFFSKILFTFKMLNSAINNESGSILIRKTIFSSLFFIFKLDFFCKRKSKIYWEVNGLTGEKYKESKFLYFIYFLLIILNKISLRRSNGIYVVNQQLKESLSSGFFRVNPDIIKIITNGGPESVPFVSKEKGIKNINFVFFGVYQKYNEFDIVIESFKSFKKKHTNSSKLYFIGSGVELDKIKKISSKENDIIIINAMSHQKLSSMDFIQDEFSIGLIPLKDNFTSTILSPIKMFDYMSLGMPIIVSNVVNFNGYIINKTNVFEYEAGNKISLESCFSYFIKNTPNFNELYNVSIENANSNTWSIKMEELLGFINAK